MGITAPRSIPPGLARLTLPPLDPHALALNGSSSYVDTADFDINDDFAISAWIKPNRTDAEAILMKHTAGGGNLIMLGLYSGKYFFRIRDKSFYGPYAHTGEWIHVALTAFKEVAGPSKIEHVSLYLNGEFIEQQSMLTEVGDVSGGKAWTIGQDWDGNTRTDFFDGAIDDVRIYDGALLPSEIKALSAGHRATCRLSPGTEPDLNYAAGSGVCDEVILAAGTYAAGNITPNNDLLVRGNQASDTFVNITDTASKRFMDNLHHAITLQKMTIRNGNISGGGFGGAIYNRATMSLEDLVLTNNTSSGEGGAVYNSGSITLSNVLIHDNTGSAGGGFANASMGQAILNSVHIWNNNGSGGGGILNTNALTITDSLIEKNKTANSGGGILNYGTLLLVDSEVSGNEANGQGGGLYNDDFSIFVGTATVRGSLIYSNSATGSGGGITNAGVLALDQSTISGNRAQNHGGGIDNSQLALRIDIDRSTISNNQAGGEGAGLSNAAEASLTNSTVSGNHRTSPGDGAGIYSTAPMSLTHVTITDNIGTASGSTNALLTFGGTLNAYNTLVVDNGSGSATAR
ncbi:MAG: hypothetical protein HC802_05235 [Caldilineaceae bacterium]|nr:hypothetical protein [Caldilineaceae bacterium]